MHSNVIRKGQEDTTKRKKKMTITSRKKFIYKKTKQKIKRNKRKQRSFLSLYFSLRAAVGSRIIQSQSLRDQHEKIDEEKQKERRSPLVFTVYAF